MGSSREDRTHLESKDWADAAIKRQRPITRPPLRRLPNKRSSSSIFEFEHKKGRLTSDMTKRAGGTDDTQWQGFNHSLGDDVEINTAAEGTRAKCRVGDTANKKKKRGDRRKGMREIEKCARSIITYAAQMKYILLRLIERNHCADLSLFGRKKRNRRTERVRCYVQKSTIYQKKKRDEGRARPMCGAVGEICEWMKVTLPFSMCAASLPLNEGKCGV